MKSKLISVWPEIQSATICRFHISYRLKVAKRCLCIRFLSILSHLEVNPWGSPNVMRGTFNGVGKQSARVWSVLRQTKIYGCKDLQI